MTHENSKATSNCKSTWGLACGAVLAAFTATVVLTTSAEAKKGKHHYYGSQSSFSGTIVARRFGKHGNVSGVVLKNGTALHFPRHQAAMAGALKVGQPISGTGYWTYKKEGRVIAPTSLGR